MSEFKFIDCNQAAHKLKEENYLVVDIRDKDSYNQGHIEGAVNLTNDNIDFKKDIKNVSFFKNPYLQYNRLDPNKSFESFILGRSNKLAYEASLKTVENLSHYNPFYIYAGVGMGKTHLLNSMGLEFKRINKISQKNSKSRKKT